MKKLIIISGLIISQMLSVNQISAQSDSTLQALKDTLTNLLNQTENEFFELSCQSIIDVLDSKDSLTTYDSVFVEDVYTVFSDVGNPDSPRNIEKYLSRNFPFTLSWISPTDSAMSMAWLKPPTNWDPLKAYPLYITHHGTWQVAFNTIYDYLTWPYLRNGSGTSSYAFEDGYSLSPRGRDVFHNSQEDYPGFQENVFEAIEELKKHVLIDTTKQYISGHSLGAMISWYIGYNNPEMWRSIGMQSGSGPYIDLVPECETLKNMPIYVVCGRSDELGFFPIAEANVNQLRAAGNNRVNFVAFDGGHQYRESDVQNMYDWWINDFPMDTASSNDNQIINDYSSLNTYAYPNPFSKSIHIRYTVPTAGMVTLKMFNSLGQEIESLLDRYHESGEYTISWDPINLTNGIYIYRLVLDNSSITNDQSRSIVRKIMLQK